MPKEIWINLPVKDVNKAKDFFVSLGFTFNAKHSNESMAAMQVSDKSIALMLFEMNTFAHVNQLPATDTKLSSEVLFSLDAASKEEVDEWAKKQRRPEAMCLHHQLLSRAGCMAALLLT